MAESAWPDTPPPDDDIIDWHKDMTLGQEHREKFALDFDIEVAGTDAPGKDAQKSSAWVFNGRRFPVAPAKLNDKSLIEEVTSYYLQYLLTHGHILCPEPSQFLGVIEPRYVYGKGDTDYHIGKCFISKRRYFYTEL